MDNNFIQFENVKKDYKTGEVTLTALHDVSFSIGKGEICVIVALRGGQEEIKVSRLRRGECPIRR